MLAWMKVHAVHIMLTVSIIYAWYYRYAYFALLARYGGIRMPDVRASLSVDWHKELKKEAADEGLPIKDLVAKILMHHLEEKLKEKGKPASRGKRLWPMASRGDDGRA
jgi:hypothetical protein